MIAWILLSYNLANNDIEIITERPYYSHEACLHDAQYVPRYFLKTQGRCLQVNANKPGKEK